jgi:hypothetical protein
MGTGAKAASGYVTSVHLVSFVSSSIRFSLVPGQYGYGYATCPPNTAISGGGVWNSLAHAVVQDSFPATAIPNTYVGGALNNDPANTDSFKVYAICLQLSVS